jgi:probable HAF family extracellular repeat protein
MNTKTLIWCLLALVTSNVADTRAAKPVYAVTKATVTDLGTLGGEESVALDINNAGEIVGWSKTSQGGTHAFLFRNGSMEDIGATGGSTNSEAHGINNKTEVVGFFRDNNPPPNDFTHAFFLRPGEPLTPFPEGGNPDCKPASVARAINDSRTIVGSVIHGNGLDPCTTRAEIAVRWKSHPAFFTRLRLLEHYPPHNRALDINNQGRIIEYFSQMDGIENVEGYFLWNSGSVTPVPDPVAPSMYSYRRSGIDQVAGINDYGAVVVNALYFDHAADTRYTHALFRRKTGVPTVDLGTLSGGKESFGYEINNQNMIAGMADRPRRSQPGSLVPKQTVGFLWHNHFGMRALPKLPSNSLKCEAYSLNNRASSPPGLVQVVGFCTVAGKRHAVRWDVTVGFKRE